MDVSNELIPSTAQLEEFFGQPEDGPFMMVNLLKFRSTALYKDGSEADLPGWQAYMRYAAAVLQCLKRAGAKQITGGQVTGLMLGQIEEPWDMIALVEYPSLEAMQTMIRSPEYQAISVHRDAGLEGQLNIKIKPFDR